MQARAVDHVDVGDGEPVPVHEGRQEPVERVEERQVEIDLPADAGEAASGCRVCRPAGWSGGSRWRTGTAAA